MAQKEIIFSVNANVEAAAEKFRKLEAEQKQAAEKLASVEKLSLNVTNQKFVLEQRINKLYQERLQLIERMSRRQGFVGNIHNQMSLAGNTAAMMSVGSQYANIAGGVFAGSLAGNVVNQSIDNKKEWQQPRIQSLRKSFEDKYILERAVQTPNGIRREDVSERIPQRPAYTKHIDPKAEEALNAKMRGLLKNAPSPNAAGTAAAAHTQEIKEVVKAMEKLHADARTEFDKVEKGTIKYIENRSRQLSSRIRKTINRKTKDPMFRFGGSGSDTTLIPPTGPGGVGYDDEGLFGKAKKFFSTGKGLGAGVSGYGMYKAVRNAYDYGNQIGESARNLNVSAEYYQPRAYAGKATGMNFEGAYSTFDQSRRSALGGDMTKSDAFRKLGITDISNGQKAFDQLTATLKKNAGDVATLRNAYLILGDATQDVVKGIESGYEELRKLAESSKPSNEAIANVMLLKATFDDLWNTIKVGILELLRLVNAFNIFGKALAGFKGLGAGVGGFFGTLSAGGSLKDAWKAFRSQSAAEADKAGALEKAATRGTQGEKVPGGKTTTVPKYQDINLGFSLPGADQLQRIGLTVGGGGTQPLQRVENILTRMLGEQQRTTTATQALQQTF